SLAEALALAAASSALMKTTSALSASTSSGSGETAASMAEMNQHPGPDATAKCGFGGGNLRLSSAGRTPAVLWVAPVDPVEQASQLGAGHRHSTVHRRGPDEAPLLKPLGIERHADPVVPNHLHQQP